MATTAADAGDVSRRRQLLTASLPLLASALLVVIFSTVLSNFFQVGLRASALLADTLAGAVLAYWLHFLLRPLWLFLVVLTLSMGLLYLSTAFKIAYFAAPVMPADLLTLPALLADIPGWRFLLMVAPLAGLPLLFLAGLRWRWRTPLLLLAGVSPVIAMFVFAPGAVSRALDATFEYKPFGAVTNFEARGPILYMVNEYARARDVAGESPAQDMIMVVLGQSGLPRPLPAPSVIAPRDVYMFMMETLWDPSLLKSVHFSRDPLAPAFRALWQQSGESKAMVPVFGGGTPNSEFEVLCGVPAYENAIVFVTTLHRPVMCLPRILARLGYRTDAATPDEYGLWNRGEAFRLLGFQRFYEAADFDQDDRNGEFMANAPLFDQLDGLLAKEGATGPRLVYVSTVSGHYPFELDPERRPALIHSDSKDPLLDAYANSVYYDSAELAEYIVRIRARDPDAVILAFGDHLPVLGKGLQDYMRSGLMSRKEQGVTPFMVESGQSTPLLLIDGRHGPLKLSHVSLFELPHLLLSALGVAQPVLADAFAPPGRAHTRPIGGRLLQVAEDGSAVFCTDSAVPGCKDTQRWSDGMQALRADLLTGGDYAQAALYGEVPASLALADPGFSYLYHVHETRPCDIKVLAWDPADTRFGHGFNKRLKTGDSAFLIDYQGKPSHLRVWLGVEELRVRPEGSGRFSASLAGSLPLYLLGEHDLTLACNDDSKRIKLGEFHVRL